MKTTRRSIFTANRLALVGMKPRASSLPHRVALAGRVDTGIEIGKSEKTYGADDHEEEANNDEDAGQSVQQTHPS